MKNRISAHLAFFKVLALAGLAFLSACQYPPAQQDPNATPAALAELTAEQQRQANISQILKMIQAGQIDPEKGERMIAQLSGGQTTPQATQPAMASMPPPAPAVALAPAATPAPAPAPAQAKAAKGSSIQIDPRLAEYVPATRLSGRLRSVGSDTMDNMMEVWDRQFTEYHPIYVRHEGKGSSTAIPALIEGRSEFGPMSRQLKPSEVQKFVDRFGYPPTAFRVAIDAVGVYVHPDNPIAQKGLTLAELDAIFSSTLRRGETRIIQTWGDLGLTGRWASQPIKMYGRNNASGTFGFFKDVVLNGGDYSPNVQQLPGSEEVVSAVAADPFAIGYSGIGYKTDAVVTVPLAADRSDTYHDATSEEALSGNYPLARALYLAANIDPKQPPRAMQTEFIKFILSRQGQQIVVNDGYFPVSYELAKAELAKLEVVKSNEMLIAANPVLQSLDVYDPEVALQGRLRSIGSDTMDRMMEMWEDNFQEYHPELRVVHEGKGSSTATPAVIERRAEFGPMSRQMKTEEIEKFVEKFGHQPTQLRVAGDALAVYVHPDNPIAQTGLTLAQVDAIFSATRAQGYPTEITTWGDLGLTGEWASEPIKVYSRNSASGTYGFFKDVVLAKGEYKSTNIELPGSEQLVKAIEDDPFAIGYSGIGYMTPGVTTVPLAAAPGLPFAEATQENALEGTYPLTRSLYILVNYDPSEPLTDLQREFVKFIFSQEGQAIVVRDGYFPVSSTIARDQMNRLGIQ